MNLWSYLLVPRWQGWNPTTRDTPGRGSSISVFQSSPGDSHVSQVDKPWNRRTKGAECDGLLALPKKVLSRGKMDWGRVSLIPLTVQLMHHCCDSVPSTIFHIAWLLVLVKLLSNFGLIVLTPEIWFLRHLGISLYLNQWNGFLN